MQRKDGRYALRYEKRVILDTPETAKQMDVAIRCAVDAVVRRYAQGYTGTPLAFNRLNVEKFIKHRRRRRSLTEGTARSILSRLQMWLGLLPQVELEQITSEQVEQAVDYIASMRARRRRYVTGESDKTVSRDTVNKYLSAFRLFCQYARKSRQAPPVLECEIAASPLEVKGKLAQNRYTPYALPPVQIMQMMRFVCERSPRLYLALALLWLTERRPCTVLSLQWQQYSPPSGKHSGSLYLPGAKGGPASFMPVAQGSVVAQILAQAKDAFYYSAGRWPKAADCILVTKHSAKHAKPWTSSGLANRLRQVLAGSPWEKITPYVIKHSGITALQQSESVSLATVKNVAGHKRMSSQEAYDHSSGVVASPAWQRLADMFVDMQQALPAYPHSSNEKQKIKSG